MQAKAKNTMTRKDLNASPYDGIDKVTEYFKEKDILRTLRKDLKDLKLQNPEIEELEKLVKRVKEIREKIKEEESIKLLEEKILTAKERLELLIELIRIDLLETSQTEIKRNGKILKLVSNVKEFKDQENKEKFFKRGGVRLKQQGLFV